MSRSTVVFGLLGTTVDSGPGNDPRRWERWRPTVALCHHDEFLVDRLELIHSSRHSALAETITRDVQAVSPETVVRRHILDIADPWDFEEVFGALHGFATQYRFDLDDEDYLIHITTGSHVAQICLYLLTESRHFPARLVQTSPPPRRRKGFAGSFQIIDLDLSRYDRIATRFAREKNADLSFLKSGIETCNPAFNALIEEIERVAIHSQAPILLQGPTGAGKSQLARRIFELKQSRRQVNGNFVEVNCATLRGDAAMSTLFGHVKGAFTGAITARPGLLLSAKDGILFLDEIGELGLDEQAMLLRALEEKLFLPVGADHEVHSNFQLLAGTNRDLQHEKERGRFREDLLARINLWTFALPSLRDRPEDIEPNLEYELQRHTEATGKRITFSREAREKFLQFATTHNEAPWHGNFRDLNAAVTRMATLAPAGRITGEIVAGEMERLRRAWRSPEASRPAAHGELVLSVLGPERAARLDRVDRVQLEDVLGVCRRSRSLSEAGRELYAVSRTRKKQPNDADRLRKYLARFGVEWADVTGSGQVPI